jgi:hypothetical protein
LSADLCIEGLARRRQLEVCFGGLRGPGFSHASHFFGNVPFWDGRSLVLLPLLDDLLLFLSSQSINSFISTLIGGIYLRCIYFVLYQEHPSAVRESA